MANVGPKVLRMLACAQPPRPVTGLAGSGVASSGKGSQGKWDPMDAKSLVFARTASKYLRIHVMLITGPTPYQIVRARADFPAARPRTLAICQPPPSTKTRHIVPHRAIQTPL